MIAGKKIGLALGSGGSKGLAHIGVLKTLEKHGIVPDIIVGTSIGALVGGLYAAGTSAKELEELAITTNWRQIVPLLLEPAFRKGILRGNRLTKFIQRLVKDATFETTRIRFGAVVTDMSDGKAICLTTGDFSTAIRSSISVPLLFQPQVLDGKIMVDGGLSVPVPVEFARMMGADIVIAVNLFAHYEGLVVDEKYSLNRISVKSTDVLSHYLALENVRGADIVVEPKVADASLLNKFMTTKGTKIAIAEGARAMKLHMPQLKKLIQSPAQTQAPSPVVVKQNRIMAFFRKIF